MGFLGRERLEEMRKKKERYCIYNHCTLCDLEFFSTQNMKKYWILWLDILGFSALIRERKYELVYEMLSFLANYHSERSSYYSLETSIMCSDTCVNLYGMDKTNFVSLLERVAILQINFIYIFKHLIRGVLILDDVFTSFSLNIQSCFQKNSVYFFGPGIINAADFEKRVKFPVIGIPSDIIKLIIDAYLQKPEVCPAEDKDSFLPLLFNYSDTSNYKEIVELLDGLIAVFLPSGKILSFLSFVGRNRSSTEDNYNEYVVFVDYVKYLIESADIEYEVKGKFIEYHKSIIEELKTKGVADKAEFLTKYLQIKGLI